MKEERSIECLRCDSYCPKEDVFEADGLISYTCPACGSWAFDIVRNGEQE